MFWLVWGRGWGGILEFVVGYADKTLSLKWTGILDMRMRESLVKYSNLFNALITRTYVNFMHSSDCGSNFYFILLLQRSKEQSGFGKVSYWFRQSSLR